MHYDYKQSELINGNNWLNDFYNPQWDFGFGLSYTTFEYSNMQISSNTLFPKEELIVSVDVTNTGKIKGKEVVQLYVRDYYASISPPLKKLKRFAKIELAPLEKKTVEFTISEKDLQFYGIDNKWITEEGKFRLIINNQFHEFNFKN